MEMIDAEAWVWSGSCDAEVPRGAFS